MKFDPQARVNPGRFLAALAVEQLRRHGLGLVVVCPGARNQPLLGALAAREDLDRRIAVDERAAGHLAVGWLRGRAAAGLPPALAAVVTTSGSAPLLVAPALAEAQAMALPLVLLSADRPVELHDVGANQTLDQLSPLRSLVVRQVALACHPDGTAPDDILSEVAEAARAALGPPAGPVHLNLAFRGPLAPDPAPLPDHWTATVFGTPHIKLPATAPDANAIAHLRDDLAAARRPVVWIAGLQHAADRQAAIATATATGAPWIADIGSGLRLAPAQVGHLQHAEFYADDLEHADFVLQLGRRPVSLRVGKALSHAKRWLVDDHPERQDPWRQGGERIFTTPADLLAALGNTPLAADPDPDWQDSLAAIDARWRARLAEHIDQPGNLSEAWLARELAFRLDNGHALFLGNSLAVRHLDTLVDVADEGPITITSRGTSGIEGLVAQAVGVTCALDRPTVALLGDLTATHDLGSLALLAREAPPLLILVIQNHGGGIFRQLPGGRHPELLEPWLVADQEVDLTAVATAHGLAAQRVTDRDTLSAALLRFLSQPKPTLIEAVVDPTGHTHLLADLDREARS